MKKKNVIIRGGLGNQMFEYALACALRKRGYRVAIDISFFSLFKMHNGYELNNVFGIDEECIYKQGLHLLWLRFLNKFKPAFLVSKDTLAFDPSILSDPKKYLFGWWFDEKYFKSIEPIIRDIFVFKNIDILNNAMGKEMSNCDSVSIHVRRGDYAAYGMRILEVDYYMKAIQEILNKVKNPIFYLFSDDFEEAEKLLQSFNVSFVSVRNNTGNDSYKDIFLMSHCKHNIIANSSFSWWGAWLNNNPNKLVIAPKEWDNKPYFKPQIDSWILI